MMICTRGSLIGLGMLAVSSQGALADVYSFDALGEVIQFGAGFDGADAFPYAGLEEGDAMEFHFEYDVDAIAINNDGFIAQYELAGNGSTIRFGESIAEVETLLVTVGEFPATGHGVLSFTAINETLGISAAIYLRGQTPLAPALPTSLDDSVFDFASDMHADSDANQLLLPIVMGQFISAGVTPAPGTAAVICGGLACVGRRRR